MNEKISTGQSSKKDILDRFRSLTVWKRDDRRAPHKPLLVLYALGEMERGNQRIGFRDIEDPLVRLLKEFGPPRKRHHPEYPFWRLQNDGIWTVSHDEELTRRASNTDPLKSELTKYNVQAGFSEDIVAHLKNDAFVRHQIARMLLDEHFPDSLHEDILDAVGLNPTYQLQDRNPRDRNFRKNVLQAYCYQCAVCGFDLKMDTRPVGLEAAHIKWRQAKGPDEVSNGVCLCAIHHKMLDKGAIHFTDEMRLLLSESLHGSNPHFQNLLDRMGKRIHTPQRKACYPKKSYINWHVREVFQGEHST